MKGFFSVLSVFLLLSTACSIDFGRPILVRLPGLADSFNEAGVELSGWIIEYPEKIVDGIPVYSEKKVGAVSQTLINIARGINLPVLVWPVFEFDAAGGTVSITGGFPAGSVYPVDMHYWSIYPEWEDGFACEIIKSSSLSSNLICGFDTVGFRAAVSEKASEVETENGVSGGCWCLDPRPVISLIGYGLFRKSSLKAADFMDFEIPALNGFILSDNQLYVLDDPAEEPGAILRLPAKRRFYIFNAEAAEVISVFFDDHRWSWYSLTTGVSESGRM